GFSSMYGSLTTIVLIMLWMYFCMYCILLGGELNVLLDGKIFERNEK
ncbi:MAG: YihY/virulence factor BrkB family protein, partial [Lachnospiraceae bacterium]|nr:YihY/virulence factor BrkB family protein [Lachnospiraceae bacterium]